MANTKITAANIDSTSTGITLADLTVNGDINLGDNDKAIFGAGSDLQIYHDGSHSIITDQGTGSLLLRGTAGVFIQNAEGTENIIAASADGAVTLYYDNGAKLATISTGIDVTGTTTTNNLTIDDGVIEFDKPSVYGFRFLHNDAGNDLSIQQGDANNANYVTRLNINSSGNLQLGTTSSSQTILQFLSATNGANTIHFGDGSSADAYRGYINYNHTGDRMEFATSGTERMRIDSSGNVGIGETGPEYRLQVDGTNVSSGGGLANLCLVDRTPYNGTFPGAGITFRGEYTSGGSTTNFATIQGIKENTSSGNYATALRFTTRPNGSGLVERMRIDSSGNVLVGDASATGLLNLQKAGTTALVINTTTGTNTFAAFQRNGSTVGSITTNGSTTSYNTSSDYRLKENVDYDFTALDRVAQLKPARFNFIADADTTVDGFLAHEVQDIVPEAITGEKDAVKEEEYEVTPAVLDDDGNVVTEAEMGTREIPDYQGIDQSKLVPLLTKAIQEQQTIIDDLKSRIEALEG